MKWANLIAEQNDATRNCGDDIQAYAIELLYRHMGIDYSEVVRVTSKDLFSYDGKEYLVLPLNTPFWGTYSKLSPKIIPVYLGISVLNNSVAESLRWKEFEPIGCRDQHTYEQVVKCGVKAYLNGCMSLTLPKAKDRTKADKVYIIDVCEELLSKIPPELKKDAIFKKQQYRGDDNITEQFTLSAYEEIQREARLVITSRLHCAVPCVAYGVPVILGMKNISFRMGWLHQLIPIYDQSNFSQIDWEPKPVEIEAFKKMILDNAITRLRDTWDRYYLQCSISEFYESTPLLNVIIDGMVEPVNYIKENWTQNGRHKYIIWGGTQTADDLYNYITEHYKNAELLGVVDAYRTFDFHGLPSSNLELLEKSGRDATVFVTAERASYMALQYFKKLGIQDYVICWNSGEKKYEL